MNALNRIGPLAGRCMLGLIFIISGIGKITGPVPPATWQAKACPS